MNFTALLWLCDRCPSTYETALEDEVEEMKEEFKRIDQQVISKLASLNPDIVCSINSPVDIEELLSNSEEETEEEELEFGESKGENIKMFEKHFCSCHPQ